MKLHKNSQGFAVFETVLIIIIVMLMGFVGWYVWHSGQSVDKTYSQTGKSTITKASHRPEQSKSSNTKYLVVSEVGIKIPLSSSIGDLEYTYETANNHNPDYLHFTTASIKSIPNDHDGSACDAMADPLGTYNVFLSPQTPNDENRLGQLITSAGGHYIYYSHVQYGCGNTPEDTAKVAALIQPLYEAIKQARSIN